MLDGFFASCQKVQIGDSTTPIKLSFSFVKIIQFRILYLNSLILVSKVH